MTNRAAFVNRTARRLAGPTVRTAAQRLGSERLLVAEVEGFIDDVVRPLARRNASDYLSEDRVQGEIASWDRTALEQAVAREIVDRFRTAVRVERFG